MLNNVIFITILLFQDFIQVPTNWFKDCATWLTHQGSFLVRVPTLGAVWMGFLTTPSLWSQLGWDPLWLMKLIFVRNLTLITFYFLSFPGGFYVPSYLQHYTDEEELLDMLLHFFYFFSCFFILHLCLHFFFHIRA